MIIDVLTLLSEGFRPRDVFCNVRSIGMKEFYQANATDFHPEVKFVLVDYLDYAGETMVRHDGQLYRVLRTYRNGNELELTAEKAPAEDGDLYG